MNLSCEAGYKADALLYICGVQDVVESEPVLARDYQLVWS